MRAKKKNSDSGLEHQKFWRLPGRSLPCCSLRLPVKVFASLGYNRLEIAFSLQKLLVNSTHVPVIFHACCFLGKPLMSLQKLFRSASIFLSMHRSSKQMYINIALHIENYLVKSRTEASDKSPTEYNEASSLSPDFLNCELGFLPTTKPFL